jgi:DNA-binding winged helix-turn-helix (wHTH) protein
VIRQLICRLRKRLPPGSLTTVWGRGYRLDAEVARTLPQFDERQAVEKQFRKAGMLLKEEKEIQTPASPRRGSS